MPRLSFSLRDVFWLTLVVAMGVAWWVHERQQAVDLRRRIAESERKDLKIALLTTLVEQSLRDLDAYAPEWRQGHW
jgi:hypothetical protein